MADTVRVTDHAAEALSLLEDPSPGDEAAAQVHATLAVAQAIGELRTALVDYDAPIVEALWSIARGGEPRG